MEENLLIKKKKKSNITKITSLFLIIGLFVMVIGVSYAYFEFYQTGTYSYTINGGKMDVIYSEETGNTIKIDNLYPTSDLDAKEKAIEFEFCITGFNESEDNVYYAIEIDYGSEKENQNRFKDSDLKLSLYENEEVIFENEIFNNLDNQDIHYGYISKGTSENTPIVNSYKLRIWINDNVIITNTPDKINIDLSDKSVYSTSEFSNLYGSFKVNVKADLTYDDVGYITYDANGGTNTPEKTSVLTGRVTSKVPSKEKIVDGESVYNAFLGWSRDPNAIEPEYKKGERYTGKGQLLYAVYSSDINVMSNFNNFSSYKSKITNTFFVTDTLSNVEARYNAASIKYDLSIQGKVLGWLEVDPDNSSYYYLYIGSEGATYLSTGKSLFSGNTNNSFLNLTNIDFGVLDTSFVNDMSNMFDGCRKITNLDLTNFDTSQVTDMSYMFYECTHLTNLNVSSFDTSMVTDMSGMFYLGVDSGRLFVSDLTTLDISNFVTSNVTNMSEMFYGCSSIQELNTSNFDTSSVTDMSYMFHSCKSLKELDLSSFNIDNLADTSYMFLGCAGINTIYSNYCWENDKNTNSTAMFNGCTSLVGAVNFVSSNANDITFANPDTGYFTRKTV